MVIENIISDLGCDLAFKVGSTVSDAVSTRIFVARDGIDSESNTKAKEGMKKEGPTKWLCKATLKRSLRQALIASVAYGLDSLLGAQDNVVNFHHAYCYLTGLTSYSAALSNIVGTFRLPEYLYVVGLPYYIGNRIRHDAGDYLTKLGAKLIELDSKKSSDR